MSGQIFSVSIIGMGSRGGEAYGRYVYSQPGRFSIAAICDTDPVKLNKYGEAFGVDPGNRFGTPEEFFAKKRSDLLFVCTQDRSHVEMALKGLTLGYDILLEKPVSDDPEALRALTEKAKETGRLVMVCHVLRYTAAMLKLKELLDSGAIGKLVSIDHTENVIFYHQAHSYVRGNWRSREETSPMILAKCCHDMDLLQYFAGAKCKSMSSVGSLFWFRKENRPEGAAERCTACKYRETCPYSAKRIYIDMWENWGSPENAWPMNIITAEVPLTREALTKAIEEGPYGRCVYCCDNDVVDNQTCIMSFENGVTATLKMEAFVRDGGRDIRFFGTHGELVLRESEGTICLKPFYGEEKCYYIRELTDDLNGHGGGDHRMIDRLYEVLCGRVGGADTALEKSVESHYMALAAEESRLAGGAAVSLEKYRKPSGGEACPEKCEMPSDKAACPEKCEKLSETEA